MQSLLSIQNMSEQNTGIFVFQVSKKERSEIVLFSFLKFHFSPTILRQKRINKLHKSEFLEFSLQRVRDRIKSRRDIFVYRY